MRFVFFVVAVLAVPLAVGILATTPASATYQPLPGYIAVENGLQPQPDGSCNGNVMVRYAMMAVGRAINITTSRGSACAVTVGAARPLDITTYNGRQTVDIVHTASYTDVINGNVVMSYGTWQVCPALNHVYYAPQAASTSTDSDQNFGCGHDIK